MIGYAEKRYEMPIYGFNVVSHTIGLILTSSMIVLSEDLT